MYGPPRGAELGICHVDAVEMIYDVLNEKRIFEYSIQSINFILPIIFLYKKLNRHDNFLYAYVNN